MAHAGRPNKKFDNSDLDTVKIFLSFRSEDEAIANGLSAALASASGQKIEFAKFTGMRGGEKWRDWIEKKIDESHALIFIYTDEQASWRWCIYEIGMFRGVHKGSGRPIILLKSPGIENPPDPLADLQWIIGDYKGLEKLFSDLVCRGIYFTNILHKNMKRMKQWGEIKQEIADLSSKFAPLIRTRFLAPRLGIHLSETIRVAGNDGESTLEKAAGIEQFEIENARLEGDLALDVLQLAEGSRFENLEALFAKGKFDAWLGKLRHIIQRLRDDPKFEQPLEALDPFKCAQGRTYVPVISRYQRFRGRPDVKGMENDLLRKVYLSLVPSDLRGHPVSEFSEIVKNETFRDFAPIGLVLVKWKKRSKKFK